MAKNIDWQKLMERPENKNANVKEYPFKDTLYLNTSMNNVEDKVTKLNEFIINNIFFDLFKEK